MDTALNIPAPTAMIAASGPVLERSITKKVTPVDVSGTAVTRPAEKPFVAQIVEARLSGTGFPDNPAEIVPKDRTLRPYDVPMLPSTPVTQPESDATSAPNPPQNVP
jgi:hypothetical protein